MALDLTSSGMMLRYFLFSAVGSAALFLVFYTRKMMPLASYAYPVARIKVMSGRMVRENKLRELIEAMNYKDVIASFEGTTYESFVAGKTKLEEIEGALALNLAHDYKKIVTMCPKRAEPFFKMVSSQYDIENLKRIIAAKETGEDVRWLYPAPLSESFMQKLMDTGSVIEVIELLKATKYREFVQDVPANASAVEYHKMLDKYLYEKLWKKSKIRDFVKSAAVMNDQANLEKIYGMLIDNLNIKIALRAVHSGLKTEEAKGLILRNYFSVDGKKMEAMSESKDIASAIACLEGTPYFEILGEASRDYAKDKRLYPMEKALDNHYLEKIKGMFIQQPFGLTPIASYLMLKEFEIKNLKTILNGIEEGIPKEKIKEIAIGV